MPLPRFGYAYAFLTSRDDLKSQVEFERTRSPGHLCMSMPVPDPLGRFCQHGVMLGWLMVERERDEQRVDKKRDRKKRERERREMMMIISESVCSNQSN